MEARERGLIDRMCQPKGIAIFGAMSRPGSFGHAIMTSHTLYGYPGRIYPISQRGDEVLGHRIYRSLEAVSGPVDLASISVPATEVPGVLRQCLDAGLAGATIHTSGFAEAGAEGQALQDEIEEISRRGLKIIGPNCFGIHCPAGGTTFLPGFDFPKELGHVGMVFQSGGMANDIIHEAAATGVRFSKVFSFGNGCDLDAIRLLEYLAGDPETHVIAAYLEGIGDGRRFLEVVRSITTEKPVLVWKGGLTPFGGRATLSHTGSLGGESEIWRAALRQVGAVAVEGAAELMDAMTAISYIKKPGRSVAIMGGGGATGVHLADVAFRLGLEVPVFQPETQRRLNEILPMPGAGLANPLDMFTPTLPISQVIQLAETVVSQEPIDVLIAISLLHAIEINPKAFGKLLGIEFPGGEVYYDVLVDAFKRMKEQSGKEVVVVIENRGQRVEDLEAESIFRKTRLLFQAAGIPVFADGERALIGLNKAIQAQQHLGNA